MPELKTDSQKQDEQEGNTILLEDYLGSDRFADQLKQILPEALDSDRFSTIAFRQIRLVPNLNRCDLASVAGAIMQAGSLGLEIATQGECWVIPRERPAGSGNFEANLQIGYLGHLALMWRSATGGAIDYATPNNGVSGPPSVNTENRLAQPVTSTCCSAIFTCTAGRSRRRICANALIDETYRRWARSCHC